MSLIALLIAAAGCTTGTSYVETLSRQIQAPDAIVLTALGVVVYNMANGSVWEVETKPAGEARYHIVLKRAFLASGGEGEAARLFKQHARKIAATQACRDYRILDYEERLDARLIGAQRMAEGTIECMPA
jgi:hypothetical protein